MKMIKTGLCVVVAGCLLAQGAPAAPASVLLEQGIYTEETVGDLGRAIEIYQQIVDDAQANRKYVAEALFRMGRCYAASGQNQAALEELKKLTKQFSDQEKLVELASKMIAELTPKPLFPELDNCRLKYPVVLNLKESEKPLGWGAYSFYQTDMIDVSIQLDSSLENLIDRFEFAQVRIDETGAETKFPVQHFPGSIRSKTGDVLDNMTPGNYRGVLSGYHGSNALARVECRVEIKPAMRSQIGVDDILPNGDIHFISVQQTPTSWSDQKSRGFINSDFVHIESMFDGDGNNIEFTEKHEGNHFRYKAMLNNPVQTGDILLLGSKGWKEGLVSKVTDNEYRYRMNHTPGGNAPVRRVEIYRLPHGAELLETTPADLPHRVLGDGRVELLVDTIIPTGGSLLTEFRYRLGGAREKIIVEDLALRLLAAIRDKEDDVLRELSADRIEGWRDALPIFAVEARERFRQMVGTPFDMRAKECLIQGDFAAVKCVGPEVLKGIYLVLFFENTGAGWKNIALKNSPPSKSLESHLTELLGTALRSGWETKSMPAYSKYVKQISALKEKQNLSEEQVEALGRIETITAKATFHQGALVELAKLVVEAPHNHQRIVKAAELASQFGYHTGALLEVAKISAKANHECEVIDEILEQVVLNMGETPRVVQLAQDAVVADNDNEMKTIRSRLLDMQQSADYQTLKEALEGQKTIFDSGSKYEPLSIQPVPWMDGEVLRYRLVTKTGMEVGRQLWITRAGKREGNAFWEIEQRVTVPVNNTEVFTQVQIDQAGLSPISSRSKHQMGEAHAQYQSGKVIITQGTQADAKPREIVFSDRVFDNDQVISLIRCLPLDSDYRATFPIMSILSGATSLECRVRVVQREEITVPAGTFDCWKIRLQVYSGAIKAIEQQFWYSVKNHLLIKIDTNAADVELVENGIAKVGSLMRLKEHGADLALPANWFGYELPNIGSGSEIVRLLPPEMKLEGMLCKTVRQPLTMSVQEIATTDIEVLKGYFKNYVVRADSVVEKELNGSSAYIYAADYEDQGKAKVEYRAYYVAGSRVFWFVFRMNAEQFDEERATLNAVIEGLDIYKAPVDK